MITEEAGKVATAAIDGLKGSPSCLAAIIFAAMLAILTYFALRDEETRMHERQMLMIDKCFPDQRREYHPTQG